MRGANHQAANGLLFGTRKVSANGLAQQIEKERAQEVFVNVKQQLESSLTRLVYLSLYGELKIGSIEKSAIKTAYEADELKTISVYPRVIKENSVSEIHFDSDYKLHNSKGPAVVLANGSFVWMSKGVVHRRGLNNPAYVCYQENGLITKNWFRKGENHRDDDKPAKTTERDGEIIKAEWFQAGKLHRENGPALIEGETEEWYKHGRQIRSTAEYRRAQLKMLKELQQKAK